MIEIVPSMPLPVFSERFRLVRAGFSILHEMWRKRAKQGGCAGCDSESHA
jgi:hypothetical protein